MIHAMLWTIALVFWIWVGINALCLVLGGVAYVIDNVGRKGVQDTLFWIVCTIVFLFWGLPVLRDRIG